MAVFRCAVSVLRTRKQGFDYNFHHRASRSGGLYAFWLDAGACLYVGESNNISRRMSDHRFREHNDELEEYFIAYPQQIQVSYVALPSLSRGDRLRLEDKLKITLRPLTNKV